MGIILSIFRKKGQMKIYTASYSTVNFIAFNLGIFVDDPKREDDILEYCCVLVSTF
jgi:hypothetical protein